MSARAVLFPVLSVAPVFLALQIHPHLAVCTAFALGTIYGFMSARHPPRIAPCAPERT